MNFLVQMRDIANAANNRLAAALDAQTKADREVTEALASQREVMRALRAVSEDHFESSRGATLESRSEGRAYRGDVQNGAPE